MPTAAAHSRKEETMRPRGASIGPAYWLILLPSLLLSSRAAAGPIPPLPGKIDPHLREAFAAGKRSASVWIFLADKGGVTEPLPVTDRAAARRAKTGIDSFDGDVPIYGPYTDSIAAAGATLCTRSRWLNGVSATAGAEAIERIAAMDFVIRIEETARKRRTPPPPSGKGPAREAGGDSLAYGLAKEQLEQIGVPPLHEAGYSGKGVRVLILDSGFDLAAPCFDSLDVAASRDFIAGDGGVSGPGDEHGTATLSVLGGYDPGWLVGPAYGATFYLARTEDIPEYWCEEGFWIRAIEWGESLGVDVASSSVGYLDWYTYAEMDGGTAPITLAAVEATRLGVVVVNSQGNEANTEWHYLIAPADGETVLSAGAVTLNGERASFSSFGPTADGRIKPDVCALGKYVAGIENPNAADRADIYGTGLSGTSFSCPLLAGVAALFLEAHPIATPALVQEALRATASQSGAPDTAIGWGIADAYAAALRPVVAYDPDESVSYQDSAYAVALSISLLPGFDPPRVVYGDAAAYTDTIDPDREGEYDYAFSVAAAPNEAKRFYLRFTRPETTYAIPDRAPADYFEIGDATAPVITHTEIGAYPIQEWPAELAAIVRDNVALDDDSVYVLYDYTAAAKGARESNRFFLTRTGDSTFAGTFPQAAEEGGAYDYRIVARDATGNRATLPAGEEPYRLSIYSVGYALHYGREGEAGPTNPFAGYGEEAYPIFFDLPERHDVTIRVYDVAGRLVREVWNGPVEEGVRRRIDWDGKDASGRRVSSGAYFLRFEAGSYTETRKVIVIR